ncbi:MULTISPECIES: rod shape-determining protein MreD [unclassified Gilliamella]|uniref:rod shape-determining protein MreD n=1 Tax=unclassified Gilliamella TaxID=2685620 RepID=UPI001C697D09|nr:MULTISPECIES: rod shape-determining protein MreD [unclassified Gilliamella]MCX8580420.1 rod shape-determining protein MreD [Gilliamella sp. B3482]MCX8595964.1 rod shape-determining protein MreD [Gilliamella sp. B3493]MCX8598162.1 rod shape-determining protein MreD [Gilliamella sp. B3486]MCX8683378.1 rod shape-determining protein MreD [Gilliamella sp. B2889]MCX8688687.1 rod shape-determining protein MreD [Gilliamella sp. B2973]
MRGNNRISILVIWLTLLIGLCVQIIPWSPEYNMFKPHLLMLIMAYWLIALPHRIGMGMAFLLGIILDLFSGSLLGIHAFIFSCVAYLLMFKFQLIRNLALWQQSIIIFAVSLCYNILVFLFQVSIYHTITISPLILVSSFVDGVLWIVIYLFLRLIRRNFAIN